MRRTRKPLAAPAKCRLPGRLPPMTLAHRQCRASSRARAAGDAGGSGTGGHVGGEDLVRVVQIVVGSVTGLDQHQARLGPYVHRAHRPCRPRPRLRLVMMAVRRDVAAPAHHVPRGDTVRGIWPVPEGWAGSDVANWAWTRMYQGWLWALRPGRTRRRSGAGVAVPVSGR